MQRNSLGSTSLIDYYIQPWSWVFLPRSLLQKCVLQQLIIVHHCYAINSSVKCIHWVVSLLSSLFLPTIVAWKRAQARPYYVVASGLGSEEEVLVKPCQKRGLCMCRNVREIRWAPAKEPVKPLGWWVTLPKTTIKPEDKPKDENDIKTT